MPKGIVINNDVQLLMLNQIALLLKQHKNETILRYTIDVVSHLYFIHNVLPHWVGEAESYEFIEEFMELAERYD